MFSKGFFVGAVALSVALSAAVWAGGHLPQEQRQAAMKANGGHAKALGNFAKGTTAYDQAKVLAALQGMKSATAGFTDYFPEGSEGGKTKAAPAIWSNRAGFNAAFAKFQGAVDAAIAAQPASAAQLQPLFGAIGQACGGCHEAFRLK